MNAALMTQVELTGCYNNVCGFLCTFKIYVSFITETEWTAEEIRSFPQVNEMSFLNSLGQNISVVMTELTEDQMQQQP